MVIQSGGLRAAWFTAPARKVQFVSCYVARETRKENCNESVIRNGITNVYSHGHR